MAKNYLDQVAERMAGYLLEGEMLSEPELVEFLRHGLNKVHRRALRLCKDKKISATVASMFETPKETL